MKFYREIDLKDVTFFFRQLDNTKRLLLESDDNFDINYYKNEILYDEELLNKFIVEV